MATYKVWLTVKDSYGNIKEVDGGNISIDLSELTPKDISQIEEALPLEDYIKRANLDTELEAYAKDDEVVHVVKQEAEQIVEQKVDTTLVPKVEEVVEQTVKDTVTEVVQEKVESGEIVAKTDVITYDTW